MRKFLVFFQAKKKKNSICTDAKSNTGDYETFNWDNIGNCLAIIKLEC